MFDIRLKNQCGKIMNKPLSILLIEDNYALAKQITSFFEGLKWQVDYAAEGKLGQKLALTQYFDVVILDLNLPDCDGLEVCEYIKRHAKRVLPILMLTARDALDDKTQGFNRGADDYLTKPFDLRELSLRCQAMARRPSLHNDLVITRGKLKLDVRSRTVSWGETPVKVTKIGFDILRLLAEEYPQPVARGELINLIWGDSPPESDALKSHVYGLRKALEKAANHSLLQTVSSVGYKLEGLDGES